MILLLDCGNSQAKWAVASLQGQWLQSGQTAYPQLAARLSELLSQWPAIQQLALASVAGKAAQDALAAWSGRLPVFTAYSEAQAEGLRSGYAQPASLGVDRWLALLAARHYDQTDLLVIDAGSAITCDWLSAEGQHQGGWILPGIWQQARLWAKQFGLTDWPPSGLPCSQRLGQDTASALLLGVESLLQAWLFKLRQDFGQSQWILTGGDALQLASYCDWPVQHRPNLVLEGLFWQWQRLCSDPLLPTSACKER